jgi:hypothetical protein
MIAITPLAGPEFDEDNGKVFDLLKSWTINGPAWTWMRAFNATRNGRQAWLALVNHFEGDAQRDRVKDAAYVAIAAACYYGDKKKFTFEMYVTIHQDAYSNLEQYREIISEEKRVQDLLTNIKDNSPAANAAKGTILATPALRTSFSNAVAHLSTTLQLGQSQDTRNISSTNTMKGSGNNRGGDGGKGNHGGRGRGRGQGKGGRNIYLGSYHPDQWRALLAEDKKRVIEGRLKSAEQSQQDQGRAGTGGIRQLAAVSTKDGNSMFMDQADQTTQGGITMGMDHALLQGTLQGSAAVGDKRPNTDSAGSYMSRRRTSKMVSSVRSEQHTISQVKICQYNNHSEVISGICELDSHVDTCVTGVNCVILEVTNQTVNVSAFTDRHDVMNNIPIVTATTALDDAATGVTYILVVGQCIYMGDKMLNSLICPNQLRSFGITVDDCPQHLASPDHPSTHSIYCRDEDFRIPLSLNGVTSGFMTRMPTVQEIETCRWIHLTNEHHWDPHSDHFAMQESRIQDLREYQGHYQVDRNIATVNSNACVDYDTVFADISVSSDDSVIAAMTTSFKDNNSPAEELAKCWNIGLDTAKKTLKCTTQKGVRHTLYPIERCFHTKQAQLRYLQLSGHHGRFYTDTFFSSQPTLNGCKMAQLYIMIYHLSNVIL